MKKNYTILLSFLFILIFTNTYSSNYYNWAKSLGDAGANVDVGKSIVSDKNGNVYLTGHFNGTVDFNPGKGTSLLSSAGLNENIFFAKYNANGNFIWAKQLGDANKSGGIDIQVDDTGNVYLLANFDASTSLDFDPSGNTVNVDGQGNKSIAFAKYTTNGDYVWAHAIAGSGDCIATSLKVNKNGNVFISGNFFFTADFDPSAATALLTNTGNSNGFIARYSNSGIYDWAKQLVGTSANEINNLNIDGSSNLFITGYYKSSCDFNAGGVPFIRSNDGNADFFVARYAENGILNWAIALDGNLDDAGTALAIDKDHNVYVTGSFGDSLDTDPSAVDHFLQTSTQGINNNFVCKYDATGAYVWSFSLGNNLESFSNSIAVNSDGTVHVAGAFAGSIDFNPNSGTEIRSAGNDYDIFVALYDSDGNYDWSTNFGSNANNKALKIEIDKNENFYLTGYFGDVVDFNPSLLDTVELSGGAADIYLLKFSKYAPIFIQKPSNFSTWLVDATYPIAWQSAGIDSILIERMEIGQNTWEVIDTVSAIPANYSYYLAPTNPLTNYRIRVSDYLNKTVKDLHFVKVRFAPLLNYPVGGEVFAADSIITVNWFAPNSSAAYFDLKFSTNGGANWFKMRDSVQTFYDLDSSFYIGNYNWKVPRLVNSVNCKVGIFAVNQTTPLLISNAFSILPANPTSFTLLSPNGGEQLERKRHHYITWTGVSMPPAVVLEYSLDGIVYHFIDSIANLGYYDWRVRDTVSSNCFIRISNLAGTISDESDAPFSIVNSLGDEAELTAPLSGDLWCEGTQQYIRWSTNVSAKIVLEYKAGSGGWQLIDTVDAVNRLYYWTVPAIPTQQAKIRVSAADGSGSNLSTSDNFTICSNAPSLELLSPNGGQSYYPGAFAGIKWNQNNVAKANLYYSIDNGVHWNAIDSNLTASAYYWLVPDSNSTSCLIKIEAQGNALVTDSSFTTFSILPPFSGITPILSISSSPAAPCKDTTFLVYYSVTGGTYDTSNVFMVQLSDSLGNFSGNIISLGSLKDSLGDTITCLLPSSIPNGSNYKIRVVSSAPPSASISAPSITLNSPQFTIKDTINYCFLPNAYVTFPFIDSLAPGASVEWSFGDGNSAIGQQPNHLYSQSGIFDIHLKVTNTNGCALSKTKKKAVHVDKKFPNRLLNPNKNVNITGSSFRNDSTGTIVFSDGSIKYTNDYGVNWYSVQTSGITDVKGIKVKNSLEWIVVGANGGARKTVNRGLSWDTVSFAAGAVPTVKLNAVDFASSTSGYIAGDSGKVFRFVGGKFNPAPQFTSANLYTVFDDGTNAFVAGDSGVIVKRNAGVWSQKSSGITTPVRSIVFAEFDFNKGYAVGDAGKIIQSQDAGETWSISLSGVDINFTSIACSSTGDSAWAVGDAGIIYQTIDNGATWERFSKGATSNNTGVKFKRDRGYLTGNAGSLRIFSPVNNQLSVGIKSSAVTKKQVVQVYPNPAQNQFFIALHLDESSLLKIVLKDLEGKDVLFIANETTQGNCIKKVDVSKLPNGVYFLNLQTDESYQIKKIIVLN